MINTKTGRLSSDKPNKANTQKSEADGLREALEAAMESAAVRGVALMERECLLNELGTAIAVLLGSPSVKVESLDGAGEIHINHLRNVLARLPSLTIKANALYPGAVEQDGYFRSPYDYSPIISSLGEVHARVDTGDYQGDTFVLVRDASEGKWGFVCIGWGSCSGCDALQGCKNIEEVGELIGEIQNSVVWKPNLSELYDWLSSRPPGNDWYHTSADFHTFLSMVRDLNTPGVI